MEEKNGILNRLIIILYFIVAFIPTLGAHEIVNTQWLYIGTLNFLSLGYIFYKRKEYDINNISKLAFSVFIGGFVFLLVALLSITKSVLVSESIVALSFLVLTITALFVFYIIVKQNPKKYFVFFAALISVIGFIEALQVVSYFNNHNKEPRTNQMLDALTHNYGNRNILAISIVMKLPFIFYFFVTQKKIYKIASSIALFFLFSAVLLIGARTAIFGGGVILVLLMCSLILIEIKLKKELVYKVLSLFLITGLGLFLSLNLNKIRGNKLNNFNDLIFTKHKTKLLYKSKSNESLKSNKNKKSEALNSSGRDKFWAAAIEDIKKNPVLGVGIGNWKLMPKGELVKETKKENYFYPKRVHNDLLQVFSETGVVGFLIYLSLCVMILFVLIKKIVVKLKGDTKEESFVPIVLLMSLSIYFLDSFFNFPHERTPIQIFTFFILALVLSLNITDLKIRRNPFLVMFSILSIVFLPINFQNYQASKVHKILYTDFIGKDFFKDTYNTSYEEMLTMLPNFPELDAYGRSIGIMKAFFAYNSKEKEKAIIHISEAQKDGPFHSEPHGLKALLYYQDKDLKNKDSAFYYAKKAFEIQPSKKQNFQILRRIYAANNDTVNLIKTLNVYTSVRKSDVDGWIKKAEHLYVYKKGYKRFLEVIDSGLIYSPTNEKLLKYKKEKGKFGKESKKIKQQNNVLIEKYYDTGINFFNKKEYGKAKKELTKVLKIDEGNMAATVNLGVLERILKNYKVSINHLTKVIDKNFMKNGVPEYNRGLCHYKLGDNDKALKDFEISKIKGHKSAQKMIDKIKK